MIHVRIHDLRHAHASWLLAGGADLQVVKQRRGHGSLRTTEKYRYPPRRRRNRPRRPCQDAQPRILGLTWEAAVRDRLR
jgi:integrase